MTDRQTTRPTTICIYRAPMELKNIIYVVIQMTVTFRPNGLPQNSLAWWIFDKKDHVVLNNSGCFFFWSLQNYCKLQMGFTVVWKFEVCIVQNWNYVQHIPFVLICITCLKLRLQPEGKLQKSMHTGWQQEMINSARLGFA